MYPTSLLRSNRKQNNSNNEITKAIVSVVEAPSQVKMTPCGCICKGRRTQSVYYLIILTSIYSDYHDDGVADVACGLFVVFIFVSQQNAILRYRQDWDKMLILGKQ
eukprot:gene6653-4769_t